MLTHKIVLFSLFKQHDFSIRNMKFRNENISNVLNNCSRWVKNYTWF